MGPPLVAPGAAKRRRRKRKAQRVLHVPERDRPSTRGLNECVASDRAGKGGRQPFERGNVEKPDILLRPADDFRGNVPGRLLNPVPLLASQTGLVGQHVDDRWVESAFEEWQELRTHPIARDADVVVRFVVDEWHAALLEERPKLAAAAIEQGPDDVAAARVHARQTAGTSASNQPEQKGLGLIVACVAEGNRVGFEPKTRLLEELVACRARRIFDRPPLGPGARRDIGTSALKRPAEARGQLAAESLFVFCRRTKLMIQMDDTCNPKLVALRELGQEIGEGNRVGAARQRDEQAGIGTRQIVRADGPPDAVNELIHVGWRRTDGCPALQPKVSKDCRRTDSNCRPRAYETRALTN